MSSVLARFTLTEVKRVKHWNEHESTEAVQIKLGAIKGEPFGSATPSGTIDMIIVNPSAANIFHSAPIGQKFNILMTPIEEGL